MLQHKLKSWGFNNMVRQSVIENKVSNCHLEAGINCDLDIELTLVLKVSIDGT